MGERRNGLRGQISADAHFGTFHFCGTCPWALLFHWGCVGTGNARLVNQNDVTRLREVYAQLGIGTVRSRRRVSSSP